MPDTICKVQGAKRLKFKARGKKGGERVIFYMGGLAENNSEAPFPDTAKKEYNDGDYVTLSSKWKDYVIDLDGFNMSRIASGFAWVTSALYNLDRTEIVFYLD